MVVNVRVIVRFFFKMSFFRMKSNIKDTSFKRPFKISKELLKSKKLNQILPFIVQSHFPSYRRPFDGFKLESKQALVVHG